MEIVQKHKKILLESLKNGLGVSKSCNNLEISPREFSDYCRTFHAFKNECIVAVNVAYRAKLDLATAYAKKGKMVNWQLEVESMNYFITSINLWESYCRKEDYTDDALVACLMQYRNIDEVATVMGFELRELCGKVSNSGFLFKIFSKYGAI